MYSIQGDYTGKIEHFTLPSTTLIPTKEPESETTKKVKKMYPKCHLMITKLIEKNFVPGAIKSVQTHKEQREQQKELGKAITNKTNPPIYTKEEMEQIKKDGCGLLSENIEIAFGNFILFTLDENDKKAKTKQEIKELFEKKRVSLSDTDKYGGPIKTCDLANKIEDYYIESVKKIINEIPKLNSLKAIYDLEIKEGEKMKAFLEKNDNAVELEHELTNSRTPGMDLDMEELPKYLDCVKEKNNLRKMKIRELVNERDKRRIVLLKEEELKREKEEKEKRIKEEKEAAEKLLYQQIGGGVGIVLLLLLIYFFFLKK
jgi:hypothetical protein